MAWLGCLYWFSEYVLTCPPTFSAVQFLLRVDCLRVLYLDKNRHTTARTVNQGIDRNVQILYPGSKLLSGTRREKDVRLFQYIRHSDKFP